MMSYNVHVAVVTYHQGSDVTLFAALLPLAHSTVFEQVHYRVLPACRYAQQSGRMGINWNDPRIVSPLQSTILHNVHTPSRILLTRCHGCISSRSQIRAHLLHCTASVS